MLPFGWSGASVASFFEYLRDVLTPSKWCCLQHLREHVLEITPPTTNSLNSLNSLNPLNPLKPYTLNPETINSLNP